MAAPAAPTTDASEALERIFAPQSVAIVGVPRGRKTGRMLMEGLMKPGFKGALYPINPNADEILGLKAYPSVSAIGKPVDLAIVVTPPDAVPAVLEECGRAGVAGAVVFPSGFDELGTAEGEARSVRLLAAAREAGVRLIGPNCMGLYVPARGLATGPGSSPNVGDVSFLSQSGSMLSFFAREGAQRGFAFSKGVSMGNQLDLTAADFVRYLADDDDTNIIGMYLEGARDGRALFEALRYAGARKPVVLWKSGRTDGGSRAVRSHTGALAGSHAVWEAMARQSGVMTARNVGDLADTVVALRMHPRPAGRGLAVITGPGGPAMSAVDAAEEAGLRLATLRDDTIERLRPELAPVGTSPRNPVDIGLQPYGAMDVYTRTLEIVCADPAVDGVVIIAGHPEGEEGDRFLDMLMAVKERAGKPVAFATLQVIDDPATLARYVEGGVGLFPTADRAVRAFATLAAHHEQSRR